MLCLFTLSRHQTGNYTGFGSHSDRQNPPVHVTQQPTSVVGNPKHSALGALVGAQEQQESRQKTPIPALISCLQGS